MYIDIQFYRGAHCFEHKLIVAIASHDEHVNILIITIVTVNVCWWRWLYHSNHLRQTWNLQPGQCLVTVDTTGHLPPFLQTGGLFLSGTLLVEDMRHYCLFLLLPSLWTCPANLPACLWWSNHIPSYELNSHHCTSFIIIQMITNIYGCRGDYYQTYGGWRRRKRFWNLKRVEGWGTGDMGVGGVRR